MDAVTQVPAPLNEPVLDYAPGSSERAELELAGRVVTGVANDTPLGQDRFDVGEVADRSGELGDDDRRWSLAARGQPAEQHEHERDRDPLRHGPLSPGLANLDHAKKRR